MGTLLKSKTLNVSIRCSPEKVYAFVSNPKNLPKWAEAFCRSVRKEKGAWIIESPDGPVKIRFVKKNDFGILDHYVSPAPGVEVYVPMRVLPNGGGSEVIFTLFQPAGMSDEKFAEDIGWVKRDLRSLKTVLET